MKNLRKPTFRKVITAFFLINFLGSVFLPNYAFALTGGPHQIEYTSYEEPGATDMVNLLTGDFTYNIPLLTIPGPEGSFTVPIFYHAGIGLEDEASWVGLGWNINAGSISRQIAGYPDDSYDAPITINVQDPGGSGYVKNYVLYKRTWDSQKGYGGGINFFGLAGADWEGGSLKSGMALGMNFNKNGIQGYWAENVMNVGNAVFTVASFGASSFAGGAKMAAMDIAELAVTTGMTLYQGYLSQGTFSSTYNNWSTDTKVSNLGFRTDYKYWLDDNRTERAFGSLYLGSQQKSTLNTTCINPDCNSDWSSWPRVFSGPPSYFNSYSIAKGFLVSNFSNSSALVSSDMYAHVDPSKKYSDIVTSTHLAYDQFNVMSGGISGTISPYRLEIGSLSQPKRYSWNSYRQNLIPFVDEISNKVQFSYNGQFSNTYRYHVDADFGINHQKHPTQNAMYYHIYHNKFISERKESDRLGLNDSRIIAGKNIEWFSNEEILSGLPVGSGKFIDNEYAQTLRVGRPPKGIGAFSITREDGRTFHYALPIYNRKEIDFVGKKGEEQQKFSKSYNSNEVATTWLLTAITGPDFVDRGTIGLIDDQDWGFWVKFDYGLTTGSFHWRNPYIGYFDDGTNLSYSVGQRDEIYLNSIETRSHIALFVKDIRKDRRGAYIKKQNPNFGHNQELLDNVPDKGTSSMFLDEIYLLEKSKYTDLLALGFSKHHNTPTESNSGGVYFGLSHVIDKFDKNRNQSFSNFIKINAQQRIKFIYEEDPQKQLCYDTPNSFEDPNNPPLIDNYQAYPHFGKLTLSRIQTFGRNDTKLFPDYRFEYGFNPVYDKNKWDGWGYYNSEGTSTAGSHSASSLDIDGSAWSIRKIITPLGGEIEVHFERDVYNSVSGYPVTAASAYSSDTNLEDGAVNFSPSPPFSIGDKVVVSVVEEYYCSPPPDAICDDPYTGQVITCQDELFSHIVASSTGIVQANHILLDMPQSYTLGNFYCQSGNGYTNNITTQIHKYSKRGGDIRTKEIVVRDEFGQLQKTVYVYEDGVVGKEPEFIRSANLNAAIYNYYDVPFTPVLYGTVTVLSGYDKINNSLGTKTVYKFETPHHSNVIETSSKIHDYKVNGMAYSFSDKVYLKHYFNNVEVRNSKVGKIKSIRTYDNSLNKLVKETIFNYTENTPNDMGRYTSGSILSEFNSSGGQSDYFAFKLIRTKKTHHPYVLKSIVTNHDGLVSSEIIDKWDFLTGIEEEKRFISPIGISIGTENVLAYKIYSQLGPKPLNGSNKNMMSQIAGEYAYLVDGNGDKLGLLGASVQTWKNDWDNYRIFNSSTETFGQNSEGDPVWRKNAYYVWRGDYSRLRTDGSQNFSPSDKFNFTAGSSNQGWEYVGETKRYDHFSMPLEFTDRNNISTSSKMGYNDKIRILNASNAEYTEVTFSSAEDFDAITGHFGGEIKLGNAVVVKKSAGRESHTGDCAIELSSGYGFIYNPSNHPTNNTALKPNKTYRVSVWTKSVGNNGRIYYKLNNSPNEETSTIAHVKGSVSGWQLIEMPITIGPTFTALEVGVKSVSGTVLFDDFRFQPIDASMLCFVYNPLTHELSGTNLEYSEYVLDNDNLYTRYEYNAKGQLHKTFRESIKYNGEKLVSESTSDYRRFYINQ